MASKRDINSHDAFPMKSGEGQDSYAQNSNHQRAAANVTKNIIREAIVEKLDLETLLQSSSNDKDFRIADLGCSVGPNTFFTVQNIIDSVNLKLESHQANHHGSDNSLEFQAFFNDHAGNDFNTLLKSVPENKQYYVAAVPGSFHGRLFPESSIHVFNSSYALHWLSKVPKEIVDKNSPAYNKGKIYFTSEDKKVVEAYSAQFERDVERFLNSRALELVPGGILTFLIPSVPPNSKNLFEANANIIGNVLLDMVNEGLINEELVDSFNIPIYMPGSEEVKSLIEKNGKFRIEKSELLVGLFNEKVPDVHSACMHMRAVLEGVFKKHFGEELLDDIFDRYEKKLAQSTLLLDPSFKTMGQVCVIKRT